MNFVFILTDTQNLDMLGAYAGRDMLTPSLDRLAATGTRFTRAYSNSPVCTPARGVMFTGLHAQVNGAFYNSASPMHHFPMMGKLFRERGYRAAYTGKWHLDGGPYFGTGSPDGGFEGEWWYEGQNYFDELSPEDRARVNAAKGLDGIRQANLPDELVWGHRVADRAIDFLERVGGDPFLLCVSFDEPHGPHVCPRRFIDLAAAQRFPLRPNLGASLEGKPQLQRVGAAKMGRTPPEDVRKFHDLFYGCNAFVDREIGRVIDAVERLHGEDTCVIYTSDHGEQMASHGLWGKGPFMYEESTHVPFLVRLPGQREGRVAGTLASHVDLMPTLFELAGWEIPELVRGKAVRFQGRSLVPALKNPAARVNDHVLISFNRFGDEPPSGGFGNFHPIRCAVTERHKLAVNLFDSDEFYDLEYDPYEMSNRIDDPAFAAARNRLHDVILADMDAILDPFRSFTWGQRSWRRCREMFL